MNDYLWMHLQSRFEGRYFKLVDHLGIEHERYLCIGVTKMGENSISINTRLASLFIIVQSLDENTIVGLTYNSQTRRLEFEPHE